MQNIKNRYFFGESVSKSSQVECIEKAVDSLYKRALKEIEEKIEISLFDNLDMPYAKEMARIMAEVLILPADAEIRIAGNNLPAEIVSYIYMRLAHENICEVIRHFRDVKYRIKHIKTYIRTALYNSYFELELGADNEVSAEN